MAMTASVSEVLAVTAPLPALPTTASQWDQALYAFLVEKGNRSGCWRTTTRVPTVRSGSTTGSNTPALSRPRIPPRWPS